MPNPSQGTNTNGRRTPPTITPPPTITTKDLDPHQLANWQKILLQPTAGPHPHGHLQQQILSTTPTNAPDLQHPLPPPLAPPTPLQHIPLPTQYTIYVDGGWEFEGNNFLGIFQEQRDPTHRKGNVGIAIVPNGPS